MIVIAIVVVLVLFLIVIVIVIVMVIGIVIVLVVVSTGAVGPRPQLAPPQLRTFGFWSRAQTPPNSTRGLGLRA